MRALSELIIWARAEGSIERHKRITISLGKQRTRSIRPPGSMETRQKLRQTTEQQGVGEENSNRKGKDLMQTEPPFSVWEVEEDSEEDVTPGAVRDRGCHQEHLAEEGNEQVKADHSGPRDMKIRRYGLRKRSATPDQEKDRDGKRVKGRKGHEKEEGETSRRGQGKNRKPKETVNHRARKAEQAFLRFSNQAVRKVMQRLEEEALQDQSDEEIEDWTFLLHDPGHTRGRMSLFKQSLHIYWVMKGIMAKALTQVAKEMVNLAKGEPDIRRELSFLRIALSKQEEKLDAIQQMLIRDQPANAEAAHQQPEGDND